MREVFVGNECWTVMRQWVTSAGTTATVLGADGRAGVVMRLASTTEAGRALRRHAAAVRALTDDPRLVAWSGYLPRILAEDDVADRACLVETELPGRPADQLAQDGRRRSALLARAAEVAAELHTLTGHEITMGGYELQRWIDEPLDEVHRLLPWVLAGRARGVLPELRAELHAALNGRRIHVGWVHGDFWLGNVLVDDDTVTGVVDWDQAADGEPGLQDIVHLLLYTRCLAEGRQLGAVIAELLARGSWWGAEERLLEEVLPPEDRLPLRIAVALSWLRHVARVASQPNHGNNPLWIRRNVLAVVQALHAAGGKAQRDEHHNMQSHEE
jgi:aminoglycoside phosphotransferase